MKQAIVISLTFFSMVLLLVSPASAIPVTWQLQGMMFSNGVTASGTFDYDAMTNQYSNIAIMTSTSNAFTVLNPDHTSNAIFLFALTVLPPSLGDPYLVLLFTTPLTNAGGSVLLDNSPDGTILSFCNGGSGPCDRPGFLNGLLVGGASVVPISTVPEPSAMLLLATGLLGLAGFRWRHRRRERMHVG